MRIVYLHQYFNTPDMAGGTRSFEMARRLVSFGHEVRMITSWRAETREKGWFRTSEAGIDVHWFPVPYSNVLGYRDRVKAFMLYALKAAGVAATLPCDVVFATSTPLTIALPAVYAAKKQGVPMVFEVRDLWPEMPVAIGAISNPLVVGAAETLERFAYRHSRRIVALSPGMAEGVERTGYPAERISVIPNSCDIGLFSDPHAEAEGFRKQHPELGRRPIILYPGTLGKVNGVEYLARLAAETGKSRQDLCFVVIGEGAEWELVRGTAERSGALNRNFFMYRAMPKSRLIGAVAAATMVVSLFVDIPEMRVNSANKFFDGLAAGKPVAVNYEGWQADLLRETGAGIVLSGDAGKAASELAAFLADEGGVKAAGINAFALGMDRFDRDRLARQLENVLLEACGEGASSGRNENRT